MNKVKFAVVYCCDERYVNYLGVSLHSLIKNFNRNIDFDIFVLETEISDLRKQDINNSVGKNHSVKFINVKDDVEKLFRNVELKGLRYWSPAIYYRLIIPFLFKTYDYVLYLDTDTVIDADISELSMVDWGGYQIATVIDTAAPVMDLTPERKQKLAGQGLNDPGKYFNSGVILFNIKNIDLDQYLKDITRVLCHDLEFPDQDALNIVFQNKTLSLGMEYNAQICMLGWPADMKKMEVNPKFKSDFIKANLNPKIIHFIGPTKPWNSPYIYGSFYFWKYARESFFYERILYENIVKDYAYKNDISVVVNKGKIISKYYFYSVLSAVSFGRAKARYKHRRDKYRSLRKYLMRYGL